MKIKTPLVTNVTSLEDLRRFTSIALDQIISTLNGGVTVADNLSLKIVTFEFTAVDKEVGMTHGLGSIPLGYFIAGAGTSADAAVKLYDGVSKNTTDTLYLRSTAIGTVRVGVFI